MADGSHKVNQLPTSSANGKNNSHSSGRRHVNCFVSFYSMAETLSTEKKGSLQLKFPLDVLLFADKEQNSHA